MEEITQPTNRIEREALMRIGEELGLPEVTAFNCIDAIRRLKSGSPAFPETHVPTLDWQQRNGSYTAESTAGQYLVYVRDGQPVWGIVDVMGPISVDSVDAGMIDSQRDWAARLSGVATHPVRSLNWAERDGSAWTTSRVVRYRIFRITHGEGVGQWMVELNNIAITMDIFPTKEAAKAFVQEHWERDQLILYPAS